MKSECWYCIQLKTHTYKKRLFRLELLYDLEQVLRICKQDLGLVIRDFVYQHRIWLKNLFNDIENYLLDRHLYCLYDCSLDTFGMQRKKH